MLIAHHTVALTGEGAPEWVHLVPAGKFSGVDGRGPYTLRDPTAVIQASMAAGKELTVDENHSTDLAAPIGNPSPARGWIVGMEARDDGLWGRVEWTPTGTALMSEKAYRSLSPVFRHEKNGEVRQVLRAGLTNTPNLLLTALNSQENPVDLAAIRAALGLPETADEAACLATITANHQAVSTHASQIAAIRTAAGVDATVTADGLIVALQARRETTADKGLHDTIVALQTQVATLTSGAAKEKAAQFVDGAIKAGRPINAVKDYWIARHQQDPAETERVINALPSINDGGVVRHAQEGGGGTAETDLTDADRVVIKQMGLDPVAFAELKAKKAGNTDGRAA